MFEGDNPQEIQSQFTGRSPLIFKYTKSSNVRDMFHQDYLYLDSGTLEGVVKHGQDLSADVVPGSFLQDYVQVLQ